MSGPHEWGELDQSDQLDPRDATLDLSGLIDRMSQQLRATSGEPVSAPASNGRHSSSSSPSPGGGHHAKPDEPGLFAGEPPATAGHHVATQNEAEVPDPVPVVTPVVAVMPVVAERPVPGSLADLRQRLERLPYGHPSSPYHVDGERKPPPPRLRHLELAPPTPSRFSASAAGAFSSPAPAAQSVAWTEPEVAQDEAEPDADPSGTISFGAYQGSIEPDAGEAEASAADLLAGESTSQFPAFHGLPHDAEPGLGPELGPEAMPTPEPERELEAEPEPERVPPVPVASEPYDRRPGHARPDDRLLNGAAPANGSDHHRQDSHRHDSYGHGRYVDRDRDGQVRERSDERLVTARGSYREPLDGPRRSGQSQPSGTGPSPGPRSDYDGSWTWGSARLSADQVRMANDAYDRFRTAEGRNLFGTYGNAGLTTMMRHVAETSERVRLAPDTEQSALLDPDTFKLRFADMLRRYPDRTADRLARRVPGAISYSFIFDPEHYSEGIWRVQDALTAEGFQLLARRNDWNNTTNRCVATMWHDPVNDLPFQVQFHTTASLEAQQRARTSPPSDLAAAWASLPAPPGNAEISDYRRESGPARR